MALKEIENVKCPGFNNNKIDYFINVLFIFYQEKNQYVSIANDSDRIIVLKKTRSNNSCYVLSLPTDIATIPRAPSSNWSSLLNQCTLMWVWTFLQATQTFGHEVIEIGT